MKTDKLFTPKKIGNIELKNSIVMAPMTRSRAIDNIPNELMAQYYQQRSAAGLIITEGTSPSANGLGYPRIPGIFNAEQVEGWKKTTHAVHEKEGKIFVQLMHCGRISHPLNMPKDATIFAPSQLKAAGEMYTDEKGLQEFIVPNEMSLQDIIHAKTEYISAAKNALFANFDGVELHGANGYLLEQFISPISNIRTDEYGGSIENRCKFVLETVEAVAHAIGKDKTGIRLSPYGVASDMPHYSEIQETYDYLSRELNKLDIAYIHLVDHSAMGAPEVPLEIKKVIRDNFKNNLILSGGYDIDRAETDLESGLADLVAFARPFINNPDLVNRFKNNLPLADNLDEETFYTADSKGYTDYPIYKSKF
ncbi:N-ethylmaleimide reductase [Flavobacterium micromati]|uniref:N-ethylmaleimide reductase n=1 Tax=Flavobacterium micromati TaxID=229205 RepID=A0A1M5I0W8_9FLAO|nr:alkene reductase [Flavobacterium micromati]SHG21966.1 N-ethylmaleimide reductase [Flavobacterium micromati]